MTRGEQEAVALRPVRVVGPVAQPVGVHRREHVRRAERLADIALALLLTHVQHVVPHAVGEPPHRSNAVVEVGGGGGRLDVGAAHLFSLILATIWSGSGWSTDTSTGAAEASAASRRSFGP